MFHILLIYLVSATTPLKLAMLPLNNGDGVSEKNAQTLSELFASELRRQGASIVTQQEIAAILSHDKQKELLGCDSTSCYVEAGAALGVDQIVAGSVAKLGKSWVLQVKRIDVKSANAIKDVNRRLKDAELDDVLDALPQMASELMGQTAAPTVTTPKVSQTKPPSPRTKDVPLPDAATLRDRLSLVTDGKGHYAAFAKDGGTDGPFLYGDTKALYAQRVIGGSREGDVAFSFTFWEPRARASFDFRNNTYVLSCGDKNTTLQIVKGDAKKLLAGMALLEPRWQRQGYALARDDQGTYYYVDQTRDAKNKKDFHFYRGTKGAMDYIPLSDTLSDSGGDVFMTTNGRFAVNTRYQGAEWAIGSQKTPLFFLDLYDHADFIYTELGVYKDERLGSACDYSF